MKIQYLHNSSKRLPYINAVAESKIIWIDRKIFLVTIYLKTVYFKISSLVMVCKRNYYIKSIEITTFQKYS